MIAISNRGSVEAASELNTILSRFVTRFHRWSELIGDRVRLDCSIYTTDILDDRPDPYEDEYLAVPPKEYISFIRAVEQPSPHEVHSMSQLGSTFDFLCMLQGHAMSSELRQKLHSSGGLDVIRTPLGLAQRRIITDSLLSPTKRFWRKIEIPESSEGWNGTWSGVDAVTRAGVSARSGLAVRTSVQSERLG